MSFSSLLNDEMDVRSRTITADALGGQSVTTPTVYSARRCRMDTLSNEQKALLSRSGIEATHKFFCDGDLTILPEYDLVLLSNSKVYRVINVIDSGGMPNSTHHLTIYTREFE